MSRGQSDSFALRTTLSLLIPVDSSPLRKKQRMSSPNYPGFIEDLSPEDLRNLSEIDAAISQGSYPVTPIRLSQPARIHTGGSQTSQPARDERRASKMSPGARNDPATIQVASTSTQLTSNGVTRPKSSVPGTVGFTSVRAMAGETFSDGHRSPSPEEPPPEQDYDSWFTTRPTDLPVSVGFRSASSTKGTGFVGFTSVGKGITFQPSKDALESLKERMKAWEADVEEEFSYTLPLTSPTEPTLPPRPVTPTRLSSGLDKAPASPIPTSSRQISPQNTTFTRTNKRKAFKPPLLSNKTNTTNSVPALPSNAGQSKGPLQFKPPLLSSAPTLPKPPSPSEATSGSVFRTPVKLGGVHRPGSAKKFTTPFKRGMRPGDPGRVKLQEDQEKQRLQELQKDQLLQTQMTSPPRKPVYSIPPSLNTPSGDRGWKEKTKEYRFFDLSKPDLNSPIADSDDRT